MICSSCRKKVMSLSVRRIDKRLVCLDCLNSLNLLNSFEKTTNWYHIKKKVLKRDNNTCQECFGRKKIERGSNSGYRVEVHHIVHKNQGGDESISNLITLCWKCHQNKHKVRVKDENSNPK